MGLPGLIATLTAWPAPGDRVVLGAFVFAAQKADRGHRSNPAPAQPDRAPWKVVGTRADPAPAGTTTG